MIDDMQYDLSQATQRAYKLEILLEESYTKLKTATFCGGLNLGDGSKFGDKQVGCDFYFMILVRPSMEPRNYTEKLQY